MNDIKIYTVTSGHKVYGSFTAKDIAEKSIMYSYQKWLVPPKLIPSDDTMPTVWNYQIADGSVITITEHVVWNKMTHL